MTMFCIFWNMVINYLYSRYRPQPSLKIIDQHRTSQNSYTMRLKKLLIRGCITEVHKKPYLVNPLTVSDNKGKLRMVLACRHLNLHLFKEKVKYEDAQIVKDVFKKGDHVVTFDLKSAYHHIGISEQHKKFLGFAWDFGNNKKYFVFNVLPFGVSTAAFIFSKVMRCVITYWRGKRS